MHKAFFFMIVSTISLHAMKIQKEPVSPAPFCFGAPLKFFAQLPNGFWPPLVRIPISPCSIQKTAQKDLHELFVHVPGIKTKVNKGHQFELKAAQFIRRQHRDAVCGFCMDISIESPEEKLRSDFDVVTGDRIVECKSSPRLSRVQEQIKKHLKMLTIIREIVRNFGQIKLTCEKQKNILIFKAGRYTLSSSWISKFMMPKSRKPVNEWKSALVALAAKTYTLCYPQLRKCGKKRLARLQKEHGEIDFMGIS